MTALKRIFGLLTSKGFLLILCGSWLIYYVSYTTFGKEAFSRFVESLKANPFSIALSLAFLLNIAFLFWSGFIKRVKSHKVKAFLWAALPAGIILFFFGFFISAFTKQANRFLVGEGDIMNVRWSHVSYRISQLLPSFKKSYIDIEPESSIFAYEPKILLEAEGKESTVGIFPPKRISGSFIHILNFGIAPGVIVRKNKDEIVRGYMALTLLPPGSSASFDVPGTPYKGILKLKPQKKIRKGDVEGNVYYLDNPSYDVRIFSGGDEFFRGSSGEAIAFHGYELSFYRPSYWALVEIVSDHGLSVMYAGICFMLIGMIATPLLIIMNLKKRQS